MENSLLSLIGSGAFGLVIGWIAYRTLRRAKDARIGDLATVVAALGGGVVISIQFPDPDLFACYALGLAGGFFSYLVVAAMVGKRERREDALWAEARQRQGALPSASAEANSLPESPVESNAPSETSQGAAPYPRAQRLGEYMGDPE